MTDFACPSCSHEFEAHPWDDAKLCPCPKCGKKFSIESDTYQDEEGGSGLYFSLEDYVEPKPFAQCGGVCFVQLASYGDLVSLFPVFKARADAGASVSVMTRPEYADIFECITYAKAIPVDILVHAPWEAEAKARAMGFNEVIVSQVVSNDHQGPRHWKNYQTQEWINCGMVERYHDLPLVFDNRDAAGEAAATAAHIPPDDGRPLLAYCLHGISAPYPHVEAQRAWIKERFSANYRLLELGALRLPKVYHLIALIEAADVLISTDTLAVHMAYATKTPTIVFVPDPPRAYSQSEPRAHWAYFCTHSQSITELARYWISAYVTFPKSDLGRLCRSLEEMTERRIFHAVDYTWANDDEKAKVLDAYRSWDAIRYTDGDSFRTIFDEHGPERVATLMEVIGRAWAHPLATEAFVVWTHRYTHLPREALNLAREMREAAAEILPGVFCVTKAWWELEATMLIGVEAESGEDALRRAIGAVYA